MKKLFLLTTTLFFLVSCSTDPTINRIQEGTFNDCSKATIGDLVDNFFSNPKWEAIEATDGNNYVNLSGGMTYLDEPVDALVQFTAPMTDYASFEIAAFELNGIPQNVFMISGLVIAMCDEY